MTSSGGGTLYLVFTQVVSRAFTFVGNQFLLRYLSPSLLGLAVQLELLSVTILYFARESLRVALQRQPAQRGKSQSSHPRLQQAVNLAYLVIAIGLCAAIGFGYGYLRNADYEVLGSLDFWPAFKLYAAATLIELLAEPCFVVIQQNALYKGRARAETTAAIARCFTACVVVTVMHNRHVPPSVLPFAIGQLFYAGALIVSYLMSVAPLTQTNGFSLLPRKISNGANRRGSSDHSLSLFSKPLLTLTATFYAQSIFKLLLTQGDSFILSFLTDLKSQGAFALASNYGGLLSRLIFQPVEESSRNVFGRLLGSSTNSQSIDAGDANSQFPKLSAFNGAPDRTAVGIATTLRISSSNDKDNDNENENDTNHDTIDNAAAADAAAASPLHQALTYLSTTLRVYTLFTLPLLTLVPPLIQPLTELALSSQWRTPETTSLLGAYVYYLPFLATNGVLDAFVTSVATPAELHTQNLLMIGVTAVYACVIWVFMGPSPRAQAFRGRLGMDDIQSSTGLVYANMVNMALRITYSVVFIDRWVRRRAVGAATTTTTTTTDGTATPLRRWFWRRSCPSLSCVVLAMAVGLGLRAAVQTSVDVASSKSFAGVRGVDVVDVGYMFGGALVLGSSM